MNELIDRYAYEVGRRLPAKQRDDIGKELRSLLQDALEARCGGAEPTRDDVRAVLVAFGSPDIVADRYAPGRRQVIGPRHYDLYWLILRIVAAASALGLLVSAIVGAVFDPAGGAEAFSRFGRFAAELVNTLFAAVGSVTIIFFLIDRFTAQKPSAAAFDPEKLPPVPQTGTKPKIGEEIAAIVFIVLALVLFNYYPGLFSFFNKDAQGVWRSYPLFTEQALKTYLPLWNIGWAVSLTLHVALLTYGRWRRAIYAAFAGSELYTIAVAAVMLTGPALISSAGISGLSAVADIVNTQIRWAYWIVIIAGAAGFVKYVVRAVRERG